MRHSRPNPAPLLLTAVLLALSACATTAPMADVTRFHLAQAIPTDSVSVVASSSPTATPVAAAPTAILAPEQGSLEAAAAASAITAEFVRLGFRPMSGSSSAYIATYRIEATSRQGPPKPSRFNIGLGGGTGGGFGGGGIGGGVNFPLGGTRAGDSVTATLLVLEIKRRSDNSIVWEGRATQEVLAKDGNPIPGLVRALFTNFPGPSGQMVQVPTK